MKGMRKLLSCMITRFPGPDIQESDRLLHFGLSQPASLTRLLIKLFEQGPDVIAAFEAALEAALKEHQQGAHEGS